MAARRGETVIPFEQMPEDREGLSRLDVEFAPLDSEETGRHPEFMSSLLDYLHKEGEQDLSAEDLTFVRSAQVGEDRYWIWEFQGDDLQRNYATAAERPDGSICLAYDSGEGLTPEQFMLGMYHHCF
jgi:hypothetical protein